MGQATSVFNAFTAVLLLPGDIACDAIGVGKRTIAIWFEC